MPAPLPPQSACTVPGRSASRPSRSARTPAKLLATFSASINSPASKRSLPAAPCRAGSGTVHSSFCVSAGLSRRLWMAAKLDPHQVLWEAMCRHAPRPCRARRPRPRPRSGTATCSSSNLGVRRTSPCTAERPGRRRPGTPPGPGRGGHRPVQAGGRRRAALAHGPRPRDRDGRRRPCPEPHAGIGTPELRPHRLNAGRAGTPASTSLIPATRLCAPIRLPFSEHAGRELHFSHAMDHIRVSDCGNWHDTLAI